MAQFNVFRATPETVRISFDPLNLPSVDISIVSGQLAWQYYAAFQFFELDGTPGPVAEVQDFRDVWRDAYTCTVTIPGYGVIPSNLRRIKAVSGIRLSDSTIIPFDVEFSATPDATQDDATPNTPYAVSIVAVDKKITVTSYIPADPDNPNPPNIIAYATQCPTASGVATIIYKPFVPDPGPEPFRSVFEITGLTNGVTYNFGWAGRSLGQNGRWIYANATPVGLPDSPSITSVIGGSNSLLVSFTPPVDTGGLPITSYQYSLDGGVTFTTVGTSYSFTIAGLDSGTTYSVTLRAVNSLGAGAWSASMAGTTTASPTAPTITSITPSYRALVVDFVPPVDTGGLPVLLYQYSLNGGSTFTTAPSTTSPFTISGLEDSTSYPVTLRAVTSAGPGAWSIAVIGTTASVSIYAIAERVVRIAFNSADWAYPPLHVSSTGNKDALNPRTWRIFKLGAVSPADDVELTCLSVSSVNAWTYDVLTLEQFPRANDSLNSIAGSTLNMRLETATELAFESGPAIAFAANFSGSLASVNATTNAKTVARGLAIRDVANASITPLSTLLGGDYSEFASGTLVINSSGDYEPSSGEALIRKLIMRRLITQPGDFFHLPNYGAGLAVKATFSTANLRTLAKQIEMQVLQEPEIEKAKATLTYQAATSSLIIQVQARMRSTGQQTALSLSLPLGGTTQF